MFNFAFILTPLLYSFIGVQAVNDWAKPCFQGSCSYDMPQESGVAGSVTINGSPDAITDITAASGWVILGCDKNSLAQDIRLVCKSGDQAAAGCDHLHQNVGAVGKIVRLPESCGKSAFARVARAWVHEDQSIPPVVAQKLTRRAGTPPQVQGLALDTNFTAVDPAQAGEVTIAIEGATIPGAEGNATITSPTPAPQRRNRFTEIAQRRGLLDFIEKAFDKFNNFDKNVLKTLPPISVNGIFPIFDESVSCPPIQASIKASVNAKADAQVTVGVAATGKLVPPKFDAFGLFADLNGELDATLSLTGSASGTLDSGKRVIFQTGVPGLDFPGLLTIGPSFKVEAQAKATMDINVKTDINMNYKINDAKLFFPKSQNHQSGGDFQPGNSPLSLSVSPSVASRGVIEAHVIPRLDMGITALGGAAKATVFLDMDASASMTLTLDAQANAVGTLSPSPSLRRRSDDLLADSESDHDEEWKESYDDASGDIETRNLDSRADVSGGASASVNGCVNVGGAIDVNTGADASFFGLFDARAGVSVFSNKFSLFQKCVGAGASTNKRRMSAPVSQDLSAIERRALSCSATSSITTLIEITTTT